MAQIAIAAAISIGVSLASAAISYALTPSTEITGDRLKDLNAPKSNYGEQIPKIFGRARITGNLIWANKIHEVTHKKKQGKGGGKTTTKTFSYYGDFALLLCEGPIVGISKLWLNGKLVFDLTGEADQESQENSQAWADKYLRIYTGTSTQNPDPLIQASLGAENTPAYRERAYLVFERLPLEDYGNRFPQVSVEVVTTGTVSSPGQESLSNILAWVCEEAGLTSEQLDFGEIDSYSQLVRGYVVDRSKTAKQILEQLQQAYRFHLFESEGKLKGVPYERPSIAYIPPSSLGAYAEGSPPPAYNQARIADLELPQQISLSYIDPYQNHQASVVKAKREGYSLGENNNQVVMPLLLLQNEARSIAQNLLSLIWLRRRSYSFTLPPKFAFLEAGDVITLPLSTGPQKVQIEKLALGANLLLAIEAIAFESAIITSEEDPPPAPTPQPILTTGAVNLKVLDIPLVNDSDTDKGLYLAADTLGVWRGASIYLSRDGGNNWLLAKNLELPATIGVCNNILGGTGTVSVTIRSGELESVSEADLTAGENTALIGSEVVRFQTATLTATNTYTLSGLVRGVRGTEWAMSGHGADELFVLLSEYLERAEGIDADLGSDLQFKAIAGDQDLSEVGAVTITPTGASLKPYSPVNLAASKDAAGEIAISWQRRDRKAGDSTNYEQLPLSEASEAYEIEILDGVTVVRTIASTTPSAIYPTAQQITDFGSLQTSLSFRVYQLSAIVGRGYPAIASISLSLVSAIPQISQFVPQQARVGDKVTVYGRGFTGATTAAVNGTSATLTIVSDTQVEITLAGGTTSGAIALTTPGGTASSSIPLEILQTPATVNVETISGNKALNSQSQAWQYLTPQGAARAVILPQSPATNTLIYIINNGDGALALEIKETSGGATQISLANSGDQTRAVECHYNGVEWVLTERGFYG